MQDSGFMEKVFQKIGKLDHQKIKDIMMELSSEKDLYKLVFDSMIEGVIVTNREGQVILFNKAMEEFISISKERIYYQEIGCCNFDPEIKEVLDEALSTNQKIVEKEVHLGRTDRTFSLSVLPLGEEGGKIEGHIIILVDITEKKRRELQLRRAESLAALTTLSAGVAHEIKNPLASIDIHIQLLKKQIDKLNGESAENLNNLVEVVKEEIDRLNSIVQDFLFAVRPMNLSMSRENINDLVKELVEFLKFEFTRANIEVTLELGEELPPVAVDPKYLKQALLNIMKNAIEAIHESGEIRVKTEETSDGNVMVHIMDNGEGIPEGSISKIFEPYYTTRKSGTGLGLVIVYKIIQELGGNIHVNSKQGEGTVFSIRLLAAQKKKRLLTYEDKDEK